MPDSKISAMAQNLAAAILDTDAVPMQSGVNNVAALFSEIRKRIFGALAGAAPRTGNAVLVGGTKVVATTAITAASIVILTPKVAGGTIGTYTYTIQAGVSFTILSSNALDTSTLSWLIVDGY